MADRHHVHVEVLALSLTSDGRLAHRREVDHLHGSETPDAAAVRISDVVPDGTRLVHSTSWRHTPDAVVLTYAVAPDPHEDRPSEELPLDAAPRRSPDPSRPAATPIVVEDVVTHACRHLAFLADNDPAVAAVAADHPELWRVLRVHGAGLAGQLPTALHTLG